jgi:hypothetical protein
VLLYEQRHVHDKRDARTECDEQPEDDIRKEIVNDGRAELECDEQPEDDIGKEIINDGHAELAQRPLTVEVTVNHPMVRDQVNCEIV